MLLKFLLKTFLSCALYNSVVYYFMTTKTMKDVWNNDITLIKAICINIKVLFLSPLHIFFSTSHVTGFVHFRI